MRFGAFENIFHQFSPKILLKIWFLTWPNRTIFHVTPSIAISKNLPVFGSNILRFLLDCLNSVTAFSRAIKDHLTSPYTREKSLMVFFNFAISVPFSFTIIYFSTTKTKGVVVVDRCPPSFRDGFKFYRSPHYDETSIWSFDSRNIGCFETNLSRKIMFIRWVGYMLGVEVGLIKKDDYFDVFPW